MPPIFYMLPDDLIRYIFTRFVVPVPYPIRSRLSERAEQQRRPVDMLCGERGVDLWNNSDTLWLE